VLVDDHVLFREGTRALLAVAPDIKVVAECGDGKTAWAAIQEHAPDVVLLDIRLEGSSGIEVARRLNQLRSPTKVLILTAYPYETYVRSLFAVGVHGYLLKKASGSELIEAVHAVYRGEQVVGRDIPYHQGLASVHHTASGSMAESLGIGVRAVESHLSHAMAKLGARSRTQAINLALEAGIMRA
jgi:DNA-binding NarL/FixJ family response regulator